MDNQDRDLSQRNNSAGSREEQTEGIVSSLRRGDLNVDLWRHVN